MSFQTLLQLIKQGEPVAPGTPNRPLSQLDQNVRYLYELIQAAGLGSTVFARQQTVEASAIQGMPVYYNSINQRFERALATVETDLTTGVLRTSDSADVWGIIHSKQNSTLADILLFGYEELDISPATNGITSAGTYYLSSQQSGLMIKEKPPVAVSVLRSDGNGHIFLAPITLDFLDRHVHYHFALTILPAGDTAPPLPGNPHVITNPNPSLPGWLPADHAIFNGLAPVGAKFGYNLATHLSLNSVWPPLPINQAYLEWNRNIDNLHGFQGIQQGSDGLVIMDRNGIWWLSDCEGEVPWDPSLDTDNPSSQSISLACPFMPLRAMDLWFTKVNFATDATVVTSLQTSDPRIIIRNAVDQQAAVTGGLEILLNLLFMIEADDARGSLVFKELNDQNFKRGRVQEGLYAVGPNVLLTSDLPTVKLDPNNLSSPDVYQGMVGVSAQAQQALELPVQLIRLDGVTEEYFQDLMYLGLLNNEASSYRAKINVPIDIILPGTMTMVLRLRILGRTIGTLPPLTITARRVPRPPNGLATPLALPLSGSEFSVPIVTVAVLGAANEYVEAESDPFVVNPGDAVYYKVSRLAIDAYAGDVGILHQVGILAGS